MGTDEGLGNGVAALTAPGPSAAGSTEAPSMNAQMRAAPQGGPPQLQVAGALAGIGGAPPGMQQAPGAAPETHTDMAREIGQQVENMILIAKRQSEQKVGVEIERIKKRMTAMTQKIQTITERVNRIEPSTEGLPKAELQRSIAKLEEVWESEVDTLKHELWQTIQAHNHNADLMKHHTEAIDQIQGKLDETAPNPEVEHIQAQMAQLEKAMQREQAKQQQMDQFIQRLSVVQQQLVSAWGGGVPYGIPGMGPAQSAAAPAFGKKTTQRKGAKAKSKASSAAAAQATLRAEAPEFVPTTAGWGDPSEGGDWAGGELGGGLS